MIRKMNPRSVRLAMDRAVWRAVHDAGAVAVGGAVYGTVYWAVDQAASRAVHVGRAVLADPPHPNLQRFISEIHHARVDAA